ncbi:MAG: hypothetical protein HYY93_07115 [Planctomycetes bacterium]|nr:hypothetical protein [Planctomycetota bacterium]
MTDPKVPRRTEPHEITEMAVSIFDRVKAIKRTHPEIARTIDTLEAEIRDRMVEIKKQITRFDEHDRDLVTVLVINGIHRTAEEVLIA